MNNCKLGFRLQDHVEDGFRREKYRKSVAAGLTIRAVLRNPVVSLLGIS